MLYEDVTLELWVRVRLLPRDRVSPIWFGLKDEQVNFQHQPSTVRSPWLSFTLPLALHCFLCLSLALCLSFALSVSPYLYFIFLLSLSVTVVTVTAFVPVLQGMLCALVRVTGGLNWSL